jgi:hypothetical protein
MTSEEFIVVPQFRERGFCPFFCPSQSRNLGKGGGGGEEAADEWRRRPISLV